MFNLQPPILLSTWSFGRSANAAGWPHLTRPAADANDPSQNPATPEKPALNAVEHACRAVEADPRCTTVGKGGLPDREGNVSLDASIMLSPAQCGSVCYVRHYMHAVSLARLIMEKTDHVMLAGQGAEQFAAAQGLTPCHDLLSDKARQVWQQWQNRQNQPACHASGSLQANYEETTLDGAFDHHAPSDEQSPHNRHHDTVGVLALDAQGQLAGACSTSGWAFKLPGRVGDSPIIGHGLYVHPEHGAAVATGSGELLMGICGTFLAVEAMRRGENPLDAAQSVIKRIIDTYTLKPEHQAAIITLSPNGQWGHACLRPGYRTAIRTHHHDQLTAPQAAIPE